MKSEEEFCQAIKDEADDPAASRISSCGRETDLTLALAVVVSTPGRQLLLVGDDAMVSAIPTGSVVFIDTTVTELEVGNVYALLAADTHHLRRLMMVKNGVGLWCADNPRFPPCLLDSSDYVLTGIVQEIFWSAAGFDLLDGKIFLRSPGEKASA